MFPRKCNRGFVFLAFSIGFFIACCLPDKALIVVLSIVLCVLCILLCRR
ncbi:MAG: hypothetical protein K5917_03735 [Clostridiales bacterium]|nr:hypothetical protein [Clostridiales bacterium]